MEEMPLTECGDEEVVEAIVIVVGDRDAQAEHRYSESGLASHVGEGAVVIVVIELERGCGAFRMSGPVVTVYQNNVGIAIVVVVNESAARPHRLRQPLFSERAVVVSEMNSGLRRDVAEVDLLGLDEGKYQRGRQHIKQPRSGERMQPTA